MSVGACHIVGKNLVRGQNIIVVECHFIYVALKFLTQSRCPIVGTDGEIRWLSGVVVSRELNVCGVTGCIVRVCCDTVSVDN